ncbi:hypothetical protein QJS10_CPA08g00452 [Acorus calamus]|uniref:Uncharacterized protein n=1 Tax=Acorus calamus TaxID=4465 RepID=A0AAV9E7F8_ACOCL|nr:hypothetical protein QJS10_CPA08g00452 [Acorus calamus]
MKTQKEPTLSTTAKDDDKGIVEPMSTTGETTLKEEQWHIVPPRRHPRSIRANLAQQEDIKTQNSPNGNSHLPVKSSQRMSKDTPSVAGKTSDKYIEPVKPGPSSEQKSYSQLSVLARQGPMPPRQENTHTMIPRHRSSQRPRSSPIVQPTHMLENSNALSGDKNATMNKGKAFLLPPPTVDAQNNPKGTNRPTPLSLPLPTTQTGEALMVVERAVDRASKKRGIESTGPQQNSNSWTQKGYETIKNPVQIRVEALLNHSWAQSTLDEENTIHNQSMECETYDQPEDQLDNSGNGSHKMPYISFRNKAQPTRGVTKGKVRHGLGSYWTVLLPMSSGRNYFLWRSCKCFQDTIRITPLYS